MLLQKNMMRNLTLLLRVNPSHEILFPGFLFWIIIARYYAHVFRVGRCNVVPNPDFKEVGKGGEESLTPALAFLHSPYRKPLFNVTQIKSHSSGQTFFTFSEVRVVFCVLV